MIEIKESTYDDIKNIQGLWADADVMKYIWPGGLQETEEGVKKWLDKYISTQEQILAEMYGVSSENLTFRGQRNMFDHFASFGINHRSVHGIFYSLRGRGKRAYPPHVNYYQPYWNDYKQLTDYCGRVSYFISQGEPIREVLMIHPLSSMACERRGPNSPDGQSPAVAKRDIDLLRLEWQLLAHQIGVDFGDEQTIEEWGAVVKSADAHMRLSMRGEEKNSSSAPQMLPGVRL